MIKDEAIELQNTGAEAGVAVAAQQERPAREVFPLLTDPVTPASVPLFVENLRRGAKPRSEWMCGVELELFGYDTRRDYVRLNPAQVQRVLAGFAPSSSDLVYEENVLIEVNAGQMNRLTVEPGGQVEFSGAPQHSLKDVERELRRYVARLHEIAEAEGLAFLAVGFDPLRAIEEQNWFPKGRYEIMRPYLATRGKRAWDMITMVSLPGTVLTIQADGPDAPAAVEALVALLDQWNAIDAADAAAPAP